MAYRPITDIWMLCRPKVSYYGAYPAGFLERARYLLGVTIHDPVLHICGGRVRDYQSGPMKGKGLGPNDRTVDLDASLDPDYLLDVRRIGVAPGDATPCLQRDFVDGDLKPVLFENTKESEGVWRRDIEFPREPYFASLIDRPYTEADADEYGATDRTHLPPLNDLLRRALAVTRIGGRVGVLDYYFPRPPRDGVTLVACIGVTVGWGNRMRCFSVFERTAHNPLEHNVTGEKTEDEETADTLPEPQPVNVETGQVGTEEGTTVVMVNPEDHEVSPPPKKTTKKKTLTKKRPTKKKTTKKKLIKKKKKRTSSTDGFE